MFQVDVYRGRAGLAAVSEQWHILLHNIRYKRFFHYYGWWKSYLDALDLEPDAVSVFVVQNAGQPVAIFPLKRCVKKWFGLRVRQWELPEHPHLPLNDILCDRGISAAEIIAVLMRALREHESGDWDVLSFTGVMDESPLAEFVTGSSSRALTTLLKTCDYLPCHGAYQDIAAKFSSNFRSNLNKARNKLAREQAVEFTSVIDPVGLTCGFAEFAEIEVSGWKGAQGTGTAIKLHPELMNFYQLLIDEFSPHGRVMINNLKVGGKLIASQFCIKDENTLYVLKLAYDEKWSRVAPGNMLLERVIQEGIQSKRFQYVNLVGAPSWFKDWRPDSQNVYNIWLFNRTPMALALFSAMKIEQWLKPFYYLIKHPKRGRAGTKAVASHSGRE